MNLCKECKFKNKKDCVEFAGDRNVVSCENYCQIQSEDLRIETLEKEVEELKEWKKETITKIFNEIRENNKTNKCNICGNPDKSKSNVCLKEEEEIKPKFNEPWKPKEGEKYFFVNSAGIVDFDYFENLDYVHNFRIDFGNCFQTREQVEQRAKEIKVYNLLMSFKIANNIKPTGNNFIIKFNKSDFKFYVSKNNDSEYIGTFMQIEFSIQEVAQEALRRYGKELEELVK